MKKRVKLLICYMTASLFFGLFYAWIGMRWGFFIPCVFHEVTGLKCPGCGVTHMCLFLLQMRFADAYAANPAIFILLPVALIIGIKKIVEYVRTGNKRFNSFENAVGIAAIVFLVGFGILRNLW